MTELIVMYLLPLTSSPLLLPSILSSSSFSWEEEEVREVDKVLEEEQDEEYEQEEEQEDRRMAYMDGDLFSDGTWKFCCVFFIPPCRSFLFDLDNEE